ncbi:MAG: hypothetical protein RR853_09285, partial [Aurantimicrobium sp.]|uniref:hypothetical protein n=1 Tax=Aurantimicrobium sp. TaxID=1930784 RepID=UPI002FC78624
MANEGIEIEVYSYEDPTVKVGSIFGRQKPQSLDELNGMGGGQFNIAKNDAHLTKKPELLDSRNVCKIKVNGSVVQAFLIRDILDVPITKAGETYREVKGPGLKEWFDDADVYPKQPLKSFSPTTRFFNFASEASTWYSKYNWIDPTELGRVRDKSLIWGSAPDKWPGGAEGAKWIWVESYQSEASIVPCYFRYTVNLATSGNYAIYSAVDDHYELYVDGEFIAKSSDKSSSHVEATRVVVKLGAGSHVIAYKAKNFPTDAETPDSPAALAMAMFKVAKGGKETLIGQSGGSGWKCLAYPAEAPGWTPGEVLLALINEADARGVRSMGWLNPTFTGDLDSYNNAWSSRREWSWDVGTSYIDIITQLEDSYDI